MHLWGRKQVWPFHWSKMSFLGCTTTPSLISFQMLQKGCPNSCAWNQHIFPKGKYTHQHWWKWRKKTTIWSSYNSVCIQLRIERNKIELVDGGGAFEGCELLCTQTWRKSDDIMSDITLIGLNHVIVEEGWWWSVRWVIGWSHHGSMCCFYFSTKENWV
jgi:hypothetical protein